MCDPSVAATENRSGSTGGSYRAAGLSRRRGTGHARVALAPAPLLLLVYDDE